MSGYFDHIDPIRYEGPDSSNALAFKHYDPKAMVLGKTMEEQLRVAVCYWHTFCWDGFDVFGAGPFNRPWHKLEGQAGAEAKLDVAFDFMTRLGAPFFCFHDVDMMAAAETPRDYVENLKAIIEPTQGKMEETGIKLLWGTANMFSHPRYMAGAATNPNPDVAAFAALQVREAMNATHQLGGDGYTFWGGREGYDSILNTDLKQEMDQLGRFLNMAVEHKHKIGFKGLLYIEPKPHEPTKHQYDRDTGTVYGFLKAYGLENEIKVNIEPNHATLSGNSFGHEVQMANALGLLGSIDFNRGDAQNGWDTDQFPNDLREITTALYYILKGGGFTKGGSNFDAKVRRQSVDAEDLFYGHIGGMDLLARGLKNAAAMIEDDVLQRNIDARYAGWSEDTGKQMLDGNLSLDELADIALERNTSPAPVSGGQERLENYITDQL